MNTAYESFFRTTLPSRSVVEVARLPRNAAVEISVIAGR
jgi:enamine deaminase RidA (YjgF/YER057c/UK114 family)